MKTKALISALAIAGLSSTTSADVLFTLVDTDDIALSHSSAASAAAPPVAGDVDLGNGVFSWGTLLTDSGGNVAEFSSGTFFSSDWGGVGTFTSDVIDVSLVSEIDIAVVYDSDFNTGSEFSNFFYILDGGSEVEFAAQTGDVNISDEADAVTGLDVSGATSLVVGFEYSFNGGSDDFGVDTFVVTGEVIPEPASLMLLGLGGLALAGRRRRNA